MRQLLFVPLLVAVAGCASGGHLSGSRVPDASVGGLTSADIHQQVALTKIALDSAARTGDVALLSRLVEEATLVTDDGTVRGPAEIVARLRQLAGGRAVERLQLVPERVRYCTDGVLERSGELLIASVGETGADTLSMPFSMHWRLTDDGVRMNRISVGAQAVRRTPEEHCPSLLVAQTSRPRAVLWVLPPGASFSHSNAADDLQGALEAQGFSSGGIAYGSKSAARPARQAAERLTTATVGARVRLVDQLSAELSTTIRGPLGRVHGFNESRRLHVQMDHRAQHTAAGLSYDWRRFRVGGGPVMLANKWELLERELFNYQGSGWQVQRVHTDSSWTTRKSAFSLEGGYWSPLNRRLRVELTGQYRISGTETVPMKYVDPVSVSLSGYSIGLSVGVIY